jgi:hypothetical protein
MQKECINLAAGITVCFFKRTSFTTLAISWPLASCPLVRQSIAEIEALKDTKEEHHFRISGQLRLSS